MDFKDLTFGPHSAGNGIQAIAKFPNGYKASVIRASFSYGGPEGLYELAVMDKDGLCYDTPITDDVLGHLTPDEVTDYLHQIAALPARESES